MTISIKPTASETTIQENGSNVLTINSSGITMASGKAVDVATALSTATGSAPSYSARAWVNFNGTGTVAIRASGNVSSITDNGTGNYGVNFTTAMPDVNYSSSGMVSNTADAWSSEVAGSGRGSVGIEQKGTIAPTTSACRVETRYGASAANNGAAYDFSQVTVNFFR